LKWEVKSTTQKVYIGGSFFLMFLLWIKIRRYARKGYNGL